MPLKQIKGKEWSKEIKIINKHWKKERYILYIPGEGNGNPLQYSCLENPMDGGAWGLQSTGSQRVGHDWATSLTHSLTLYSISNTLLCLGNYSNWNPLKWASFLVAQTVKNLPAMWETQVWSLNQEDPLEKEMTTHSSIFAWRIPWTEVPGGLQSMESQRVRTERVTLSFLNGLYYF